MFVLKNLFKFDADTGSNGGASTPNDNQNSEGGNEINKSGQENQEVNENIDIESLTDEQLEKIAKTKGFVTEKQLDEIIANRQKRWEKDKEKDLERSKLSVKEQLALELEEVQKENEQLKAEKLKKDLQANVSVELNKLDIPYNQDIIDVIVSSDEDLTKTNVEIFKDYAINLKKDIEKNVREEMRGGGYQSFASGKPNTKITKADILAIEDDIKRQQAMAENIHLFN